MGALKVVELLKEINTKGLDIDYKFVEFGLLLIKNTHVSPLDNTLTDSTINISNLLNDKQYFNLKRKLVEL